MNLSTIFIVVLCAAFTSSLRILGLFPHPGKSHVDVFVPLMKGLAKRGHDVTVVSHFPLKQSVPHYKDIPIKGMDVLVNILDLESFKYGKILQYLEVLMLNHLANQTCHLLYETKEVMDLVEHNRKFDLIIVEAFNSDCALGLVHKLGAPFIGLSSCMLLVWNSERYGNPSNPAYIPNNFLSLGTKMTFLERVENTFFSFLHNSFYKGITNRNDDKIIRKYLGNNMPSVRDIMMNSSMLLTNSHYSLLHSRPLVPNVVEIGGIHIGAPKELPKDIEKWISESPEGVIYFSLGSMIKGHTFPEDKKEAFLQAFARLPQRVLWKWENETMPGKPKNVMIQKWMPQFDILCHPNVKAFISHGGLLGTTEAVHCGVPIIVMPQYGDQHTNARAIEANGGGVILHLNEATEEKVYEALKTVLDPQFRQKAKELSARFRDRPLPPLETAIYWVEYVARHRGAPHMRSAAADMPFYQYYLLDVISFLLVVFSLTFYINYLALRALLRRLLTKKPKPKTS